MARRLGLSAAAGAPGVAAPRELARAKGAAAKTTDHGGVGDHDAGLAQADAAAEADAAPAPYACTEPPKACAFTCDAPSCSLLCSSDDETDCQWECAPPTCACDSTPTATCELYQPAAACAVACEPPECAIVCPVCEAQPCAPCTTECKPAACVTHCRAPELEGRAVHCRAPEPTCEASCDPPVCVAGACSPPICRIVCDELPPATCDVRGCDESCDPLTDCKTECAKPSCAADGADVTCDGPADCTTTCGGGACHVTTCL